MFNQILFTQMRWTRLALGSMAFAAFLMPAVAWWLGGMRVLDPSSHVALMVGFDEVGLMLVVIAGLGAFLVAALPWQADAATRHVLPLALPITWRRYVAMRFGAGALTLLLPTVALWIGCMITLARVDLPASLRAYPGSLSLRFLAVAMFAYAVTFALQYIAGRKSGLTVLIVLLAGVALVSVQSMLGLNGLTDILMDALVRVPGPLAVFATDWSLIDV